MANELKKVETQQDVEHIVLTTLTNYLSLEPGDLQLGSNLKEGEFRLDAADLLEVDFRFSQQIARLKQYVDPHNPPSEIPDFAKHPYGMVENICDRLGIRYQE